MKRFRETKVELKITFSLGEYTFPMKRHTRHTYLVPTLTKERKWKKLLLKIGTYVVSWLHIQQSTLHSNTVGIEALNLKLQGAGTKSCTQFDGTTSFFEISMLLVFTSMEIPRALSCKKAIKWSQTSE